MLIPRHEKSLTEYTINVAEDTRELVAQISNDKSLFQELSWDWKVWFVTHPEHLGTELTIELTKGTRDETLMRMYIDNKR